MDSFFSQLFNGVSLGMVYILISLGLNLILGLMGVVNFVHGAFFMLGAYCAFSLGHIMGFWPSVLLGAVIVAIIGILFEFTMIRHIYQRIPEYGLLLTFGLAGIIEQIVRIFWGDYPRPISAPKSLSGTVNLGFTEFPTYRFALMLITIVIIIALWLFLTKTNLGMIIRAGIEDRLMVSVLGINLPVTFMLVYGIGAALGSIAGSLAGPLYGVQPTMGGDFIIFAFVVVIVGGIGSFWGSIVGGLLVGITQSIIVLFWGPGQTLSSFIILALILIIRPRGLFGVEGALD